jgi:hypothetical protein
MTVPGPGPKKLEPGTKPNNVHFSKENIKNSSLYTRPFIKLKSDIFSKNLPSGPGSSFKISLFCMKKTTLTL